jgi:hydroxyethylthiazole kinase-like uncharacterized protein yjeF
MRDLDRLAIEIYGIPGVVLMENAGAQVVRILRQEYPDLNARRVAVLCGRGNNGGDGFVIARYLHTRGVSVSVFIMGAPGDIHGDAGVHLDMLRRAGVAPEAVQTSDAAQAVGARLREHDMLIDALLGTGLKAEVSGVFQRIIAAIPAILFALLQVGPMGALLAATGYLFYLDILSAVTQTILWVIVFFFASAAASAGYLTVSEVFPMEIRAMAIALFYSIATALGGISGPVIFGQLIGTGNVTNLFIAYVISAGLMIFAAVIELVLGVRAEGQSLENVATPLTAIEEATGSSAAARAT